jgi:hypothetical protein
MTDARTSLDERENAGKGGRRRLDRLARAIRDADCAQRSCVAQAANAIAQKRKSSFPWRAARAGHINITVDTVNHVAHTATFMRVLPQNGVAVGLVVRGTCSSLGGALAWCAVPGRRERQGRGLPRPL